MDSRPIKHQQIRRALAHRQKALTPLEKAADFNPVRKDSFSNGVNRRSLLKADGGLMPPSAPLENLFLTGSAQTVRGLSSLTGFTLIELLIAIAISSLLAGVILLILQTSLDTYQYVQDDIFLQKALDETLQIVSDGDFEHYGLKDSLEVLDATIHSMTFVPPWVDDTHASGNIKNQEFILNRPFKSGASLPIGEVLFRKEGEEAWRQFPLAFILGPRTDPLKPDDKVAFNLPIPQGARVRFIYHADASHFSGCAMIMDATGQLLTRKYKNKSDTILKYHVRDIILKDIRFQYFDNTNTEIIPETVNGAIAMADIPNITAVKLSLTAGLNAKSKKGSVFINLRNTRSVGAGLIIRKGTKIKIPDSRHIRAFSLVNVIGIQEGGMISLRADSQKGTSWKVNIELGNKDNKEILKRYSIEYPAGNIVYSEDMDLPTDLPLNLLTLGTNGRYDYDDDEKTDDVVILEGEVWLSVLEMDAAGAALFIRP